MAKNDNYTNLLNILEKLKKDNERKIGSMEFMDMLNFIKQNIREDNDDEYPTFIDMQNDRIRFNFYSYYDEFEDYYNNDVIIYKDFKRVFIKMYYGNFYFYENFKITRDGITMNEDIPSEMLKDDREKYFEVGKTLEEKETTKEESVIKYYVLCSKLKDLIRTGWKDWNVARDRVESVAEHIYKTQQLALAMKYTYHYDIDIFKVIMMISIHETEEIVIGDLTQFQVSKEEKTKLGHKAVHEIFDKMLPVVELEDLIYEFDERKTKEAIFAYECDKLECDLQARLYDLENCVDVNEQQGNKTANDPIVRSLLDKGMSFSEMWMTYGQSNYKYDKNFMKVSEYAKSHDIDEYKTMFKK